MVRPMARRSGDRMGALEASVSDEQTADEAPWHLRVAQEQDRLKALAKDAQATARALAPLGREKSWMDLPKLARTTAALRAKIQDPAKRCGALAILDGIESWLKEAPQELSRTVGRDLTRLCEERGIRMQVVSTGKPIEIRLPPVAVVIDFDRGKAEIRFAREKLAECAADAAAILEARSRAVESLDGPFDAAAFFERAAAAWRAARGAAAKDEPRVEILDFLPQLALQMQAERFKVEPSGRNFTGYSRAQFAWDLNRLRREGGLEQRGLRLNLGVATGTTAQQKKRVIWIEDEGGNGEYKLTVFFTRTEGDV